MAWTASIVHYGEDANNFTVTYGEFMFALVDCVGKFLAISLLAASVDTMALQVRNYYDCEMFLFTVSYDAVTARLSVERLKCVLHHSVCVHSH